MRNLLLLLPVTLGLCLVGCSHPVYYPPPPPPAYTSIGQQGYNDGVAAGTRDVRIGLPPDPARHPRFQRPPVPPPAFEDYRRGFRAGYSQVFRHGPPPPGE